MQNFEERYGKLNSEQKKAVDAIDGPVLVIAGPGSGKTEILSLRVANILKQTDTAPSSILCLTFTDSAALNMRDRLSKLIGKDAYKVAIHTFHDFCVEIINKHPEIFYEGAIFSPADELTQREIIEEIFEGLPYNNPLRSRHPEQGYVYLYDTIQSIGQLKKAGLTPDEFAAILDHNAKSLEYLNPQIDKVFAPRLSTKQFSVVQSLINDLVAQNVDDFPTHFMKPLFETVAGSLVKALEDAQEEDSTKPLSEWKRKYVEKNEDGVYIFKDTLRLKRMEALVGVYREYSKIMHERGYYDFDDMLLDVLKQLEKNDILKYNLQEQYQYILIDEFQDTNDAQMRLAHLLTDHPVHEGRPNIMAVGDDDQAIYKFQGAEISNILGFKDKYREPVIITLSHSYRSTQDILDVARHIIKKGENRLENIIPEMQKELAAGRQNIEPGNIINKIFSTNPEEHYWIAQEVKRLIDGGTDPKEIAVISRRHKNLEAIAPYFHREGIPINYERQQNVLDEPHIRQLIQMARFIDSLSRKNREEADYLLPEILSYPFWDLDRKTIWQLSVDAGKSRSLWLEDMLGSGDRRLAGIADFFIDLSVRAMSEPMEYIIDEIIDKSGFKEYYFGRENFEKNRAQYLDFLSSLRVFIESLREYKNGQLLKIGDMINFVDIHKKNDIGIINYHKFVGSSSAVNLLTSHKAKGLEFNTVFVIDCQDDIWAGRGRGSKLPFPQNMPIAPAGDSLDDQLRLFYVALTRAKNNLYLTSYKIAESGKESSMLQFLLPPAETENGKIANLLKAEESEKIETLQTKDALIASWEAYHQKPIVQDEKALLVELVKDYRMSVTHLNNFLDITKGGPQLFLEQNLLMFPQAKTPASSFGSAMHKAIEILYLDLRKNGKVPQLENVLIWFENELKNQRMSEKDFPIYLEKGRDALTAFYEQKKNTFNPEDLSEVNFKNQGVVIGETLLGGKIDKISKGDGEMVVYDFKTGKSAEDWEGGDEYEKVKLHNYRRQLIFYKLLVENSKDFGGKYKVNRGVLEFLEPASNGKIVDLSLDITDQEARRLLALIQAVYKKIINLDFPDVNGYSKDIDGILKFEEDLLEENATRRAV